MSALGHFLEGSSIPTTQISLIREHTEALAPPRALWVPFMLGRPFGVPGNAGFQRRVLQAALQLLVRESGPVLEDFPEDAPLDPVTPLPEDLVCPVSFPRMSSDGTLAERLADEVSQLQAWHHVAVRHRDRTTLGVTGLSPAEITSYLASWLNGESPVPHHPGVSSGDALKHACDELMAYYYEAKAVQPGAHSSANMQGWFWLETAAGEALLQIQRLASRSAEPSVKAVAVKSLVPRIVEELLQNRK